MKTLRVGFVSARVGLALFIGFGGFGFVPAKAEGIYSNSWVRPSARNNLLYRHDDHGQRICDFSGCGYRGGVVAPPEPFRVVDSSRWFNVNPLGGPGDADQIQNAIDTVSQLSLNSNGFRGVIFLGAGEFQVDRTLVITNSGIVLQGVGFRGHNSTTIRATAKTQYTLLSIEGQVERSFLSPYVNLMANPLVPAGTRTFKLFTTTDLNVGNSVLIVRPFTANWISAIDMDKLRQAICRETLGQITCNTNGENFQTDWTLEFERTITRIDGSWITVDSPIPSTFELQYGGGRVQRTAWPERLANIGIESIDFVSDYSGDDDENHGWRAIQFKNTEDSWVRSVNGKYFGFSLVDLSSGTRRITVAECTHNDPISELSGNRRYPFHTDKGDHHLFRDCYSDDGRHDFAFGSLVPGPNANVRCWTHESHADTGPHQRWSVGGLSDLIALDASWGADYFGKVGINAQNRGRNTIANPHGWAGAYMTVWNCFAPNFRVRNPPTARNWLIGSIGEILESQWWLPPVGADPAGTYELSGPYFQDVAQPTLGRHVNPYSLYFAQLQQRLRWPNSQFREIWAGDIDDFGDVPTPEDTAPVDPAFLSAVRLNSASLPVIQRFDNHSPTQRLAFTLTVPLINSERVMAASLVLCMRATGPSAPDDMLFLDDPTNGIPLREGGFDWTIKQDKSTVETIEIPTLPPIAYFVPKAGEFVEFSVLPEIFDILKGDRGISLQIAAPFDLGNAGFATSASKEDPDPTKRPQLILHTVNEPPGIFSPVTTTNMLANTQLTLPISVSDFETSAAALVLTASSSNPLLIPSQNLVLGGTGANRMLTITPLHNQTGFVDITLTVSDGAQSFAQKVHVHVGLPTAPPVVSEIPDQILSEHTSWSHVPFTITDTYGRANFVQVSSTSFSRAPNVLITFGSDDPPETTTTNLSHRYIVFTPVANYSGVTTITLQFSDGFSNVSQSVTVQVNAVDDPPGPIHLVEPATGQVFVPGQPFTLEAIVVDAERDLARVEFYNQTNFLGSSLTKPYRFTWMSPPAGSQEVIGVAVDAAGQRTASAPVTFQIGEPDNESPAFLAIQLAGDYVDLSWDTDGRRMQLQATGQLTATANWTNVPAGLTSGNSANSLTLPKDPTRPGYFRLIEVP